MIGFYTDEENSFRAAVASFVQEEIEPISERIERENDIPAEIYRKMGREGIMGVLHPPEYGGTRKGVVYETIVEEEISAVCTALDMSRMASTTLFGTVLWSKFAHMFFKPAAAFQKKVAVADGSRDKLPAIPELSGAECKARYPDIPEYMGANPPNMGLGIKREAPAHF